MASPLSRHMSRHPAQRAPGVSALLGLSGNRHGDLPLRMHDAGYLARSKTTTGIRRVVLRWYSAKFGISAAC